MPMPMAGSSTTSKVEDFGMFQPELAYCPMKPCNGKFHVLTHVAAQEKTKCSILLEPV